MIATELWVLPLTFIFSAWLTPRLAARAGSLLADRPNERSLHSSPMPRTGGAAILASLVIGSVAQRAVELLSGRAAGAEGSYFSMLGAAALPLAAVSMLDDRRGVPVAARLAVHVSVAAAVVSGLGLTVRRVSLPLAGQLPLGVIALPLTVVALVWFLNLYNFMDGMDGLAGSMTVIGCGFLAIAGGLKDHGSLVRLSLLLAAATGGFLLHNLPPAKVFLGDGGSITLGFIVGVLSLVGVRDGVFDPWFPVLAFSPFLFDATYTVLRRLVRGNPPWRAHRDHLYQRAVLSGWSQLRTLRWSVLLMCLAGASGLLYPSRGEAGRLVILLLWGLSYALVVGAVRRLESRIPSDKPAPSRQ
jgi:UDP-N-acetylmuramyl pentapeptide phosphotransferase/UDP-N-acetylglucosamine-1-phosphate transferase